MPNVREHSLIMGGDDHRDPLLCQVFHGLDHSLGVARVELGSRLVCDHETMPGHGRPGECQPLLLAARHLDGSVIDAMSETEGRERVGDRVAFEITTALEIGVDQSPQLLASSQMGDQVVSRPLVDVSEQCPSSLCSFPGRQREQIVAGNLDRACGRRLECRQHPEERRFAAAGRADDGRGHAGFDFQVDAPDGEHASARCGIDLGQMLARDRRWFVPTRLVGEGDALEHDLVVFAGRVEAIIPWHGAPAPPDAAAPFVRRPRRRWSRSRAQPPTTGGSVQRETTCSRWAGVWAPDRTGAVPGV